jgi:hypothetical protein
VSDLDGTPKLYTGYGTANVNTAPVHIWPMNLDGTWDPAPAHTFQAFGMIKYHHAEGKLWCYGEQGPSAFCTGNPGGSWVSGECFPHTGNDGGMTHPNHIARHGGYTWIAGQRGVNGNTGTVWRCTTPTGSDGQFVWGDPTFVAYSPSAMFAYQGKLWIQPAAELFGVPAYQNHKLCYWDETAFTFLPTAVEFTYASVVAPWKTLMLVGDGPVVKSFDGTSITTRYTLVSPGGGAPVPQVRDIYVTADDTAWMLDSEGGFHSSTDLVTWTQRFQTNVDSTETFAVYGDYAYIGDKHDHVLRTKVTG